MQDRQKLKKLVEIIGQLLKIEGNEWLVDDILNTIGKSTSLDEIAHHSTIQNIHEYCIEKKIEKQANEFYAVFPIEEIRPQLIQDYQKMEHERRRDDFEKFCLCMYQQIEGIVNYCFEKIPYTREQLKKERNASAFLEYDQNEGLWKRNSKQKLIPFLLFAFNKKYEEDNSQPFFYLNKKGEERYFDTSGYPILTYEPGKSNWNFLQRFRTILFYYYFQKELKQFDFNSIFNPGMELNTMRNVIHREGNPTPNQQKTINIVKKKNSQYYFKFYGFLQDFVSKVEESLSKIKSDKGKKSKPHSKGGNTIGELAPGLKNLRL